MEINCIGLLIATHIIVYVMHNKTLQGYLKEKKT